MDTYAQELKFLCDGPMQTVLHPYDYLGGLIFSVAAAPEIPMPEEWLLWAFNQRGQITSVEQADKLTDILMNLFQEQLRDMRDDNVSLPDNFEFSLDNAKSSPLGLWMMGLLAGHSRLESVWQQAWDRVTASSPEALPQMQKDLKFCLGMFTTFADIPLALEQAKVKGNDALESKLSDVFRSLPQALEKYVALSGKLVDFLPDQFETFVQNTQG